jgi:8-oxo-dGTP diphosphatase
MTICATLCYVQNDNDVLLLFRNKKKNDNHKGKWNGLGGKFLPGESPEECVVREIFEESGLVIDKPAMRGLITCPNFDGENDWIVFIFTCTAFKGDLIESAEGKLEWVKKDNIKELPMWEGDYIFLNWLEKEVFFSAKFIYENKKLINWQVEFYPVN